MASPPTAGHVSRRVTQVARADVGRRITLPTGRNRSFLAHGISHPLYCPFLGHPVRCQVGFAPLISTLSIYIYLIYRMKVF